MPAEVEGIKKFVSVDYTHLCLNLTCCQLLFEMGQTKDFYLFECLKLNGLMCTYVQRIPGNQFVGLRNAS